MIWILTFLAICAGIAYALYKYGLFDSFTMQDGRLKASEVLYLPYQGEYSKIGPLFEEVSTDTKSIFKFSENFGFYFDNPQTVAPQNCRAIVGILVNEGEEYKIKQFKKKYPGYSQAHIDSTRYLSHEIPYINILSILIMVKKVYPKINQYIRNTNFDQQSVGGMMELYKCVRSDRKIQIILPLQNKAQFQNLLFEAQKKLNQFGKPSIRDPSGRNQKSSPRQELGMKEQ